MARPLVFRLPLPNFVVYRFLPGIAAPAALRNNIRQSLRVVNPNVLADRARMVLSCDVRSDLTKVDIPILYLQGKNDQLVGSECFEEIRRLRGRAILASIPGPHLRLQTQPHQAAEIVMEFVHGLGSGKASP
jgi:pimeloyl-ACP methyl ester carboxylesterase